MGHRTGCLIAAITLVVLSVVIRKGETSPTVHRLNQDVTTTASLLHTVAEVGIGANNVSNSVESPESRSRPISTDVEEGRRRKKKYKKKLYHQFWNVFYYYAWFVGFVLLKFKAILLFFFGNLTFFTISLIRVLIREVPMWSYLKRTAPSLFSQQQYPKYGPPPHSPIPPSTYGSPSSSYELSNSYSPVGLYKRLGPDPLNGNSNSDNIVNTHAHDLAYGGQRE